MKDYHYEATVQLGQMVNIMQGMVPGASNPYTICGKEVKRNSATMLQAETYWGPFPVLTACNTVERLAQALFDGFRINGRRPEFTAGAILKGNAKELTDKAEVFAKFAGVDVKWLDSEKYGFILAQIPRVLNHDTNELTKEEEKKLRENIASSMEKISEKLMTDGIGNVIESGKNTSIVLDSIQSKTGTHYIRKIKIGDSAFQVFVYDKETYSYICTSMDKNGWENVNAMGFRYFTSDIFVKEAGRVTLKSQSTQTDKLREKMADSIYGRKESVFALLLNKDAYKIADDIDCVTCVGAELIPVYDGCNTEKRMAQLVYDTTIQAGIAKYGETYAGPFSCTNENQIDYASLYKDFDRTELLTLLWTPMMSLSQLYICLDDFLAMRIVNKKSLKNLLLCADVVEIKGDLDLSYLDSFTVVCRKLICHTQEGGCKICLCESAFKSLKVYCSVVNGSCQFILSDGQVSNGLLYHYSGLLLSSEDEQIKLQSAFSGEKPAKELISSDEKETLECWLQNGIQVGLQTMLTSASIPLMTSRQSDRKNRILEQEAWNCMDWICKCYAQAILEAKDEDVKKQLSVLYGNAMSVLRRSINPFNDEADRPQQISLFTYETYEKPINMMLDVCSEYEKELNGVKEQIQSFNDNLERHYEEEHLRENLKEMAEFMNKQNEAMQKYQIAISSQEKSVYQSKNTELVSLRKKDADLKTKIDEYKEELNNKLTELKDAINKKKKEEITKTIFQFAASLCTIVGNIGQSYCNWAGISQASDAEKTLKKWEAFLNSMKAVENIIKFGTDMDETVSKLSGWEANHPGFTDCPTALEWEIMLHDCSAQIAPLEKDFPSETAQYKCVLENIVSCAKQKSEYLSQISRIQTEMSQNSAQAKIAEDQEKRLKDISLNISSPDWQPDEDALADMGQYAASLAQKENAMLLKLVTLIQLQSGAMEYQYCGTWDPITSFTLKSVRENLVSQSMAAIQGMQSFLSVPTDLRAPLLYETQIPADLLIREEGGEIEVPMEMGMWRNLSHVRINAMDVRLEGIKTNSGRCHVKLITSGNPMQDRGIGGEKSSYVMPSRDWFVIYDIASDQTIMYTEPSRSWGKYFAKPTPFQKIRIGLAKSQENEGVIAESDTVNVKIRFYLEASYKENKIAEFQNRKRLLNDADTVPDFVTALSGTSITGGWDVINFLSLTAINNLWNVRWKKEVAAEYEEKDRQFLQNIDVSSSVDYPAGVTIKMQLKADLGAPEMQFEYGNNKIVNVTIPIISGKLITNTLLNGSIVGTSEDDIDISEKNRPSIQFNLGINQIDGDANENGKVYLTPSPEAISLADVKIEGDMKVNICNNLVAYIKDKNLQPWYLGEVKYPCETDFLKPKKFYFQIFRPETEMENVFPGLLGIYILTKTEKAPTVNIEMTWPAGTWPISNSQDAAVYFSEDILWNNEIKNSVESSIKAKGYECSITRDDTIKKYTINVSGKKELPTITQKFVVGYVSSMGTDRRYGEEVQIKIHFPIDGAKITTGCEGIYFDYEGSWTEKLPCIAQYPSEYGTDYEVYWKDATFTCKFHAVSKATVDKEGKTISFSKFDTNPTIEIKQEPKSFFELDFNMIQDCLIEEATQVLAREIGSLDLHLDSMSVFAVSNLLFPEQQTITPEGVYIPRDLVLVGNVMDE